MEKEDSKSANLAMANNISLLIKFRLNFFVLITVAFGYLLISKQYGFSVVIFFNCVIGTSFIAFASSIFNQLIETKEDSLMKRTSERPLVTNKISKKQALISGIILLLIGSSYLYFFVNLYSSLLALLTLLIYVLIYTPIKKISGWNTIIGAIVGAIPPLIGVVAIYSLKTENNEWYSNNSIESFGNIWALLKHPISIYIFLLLFFWQLAHFFIINWLYRDDYIAGGFKMWSNNDISGKLTAILTFLSIFSLMVLLMYINLSFSSRMSATIFYTMVFIVHLSIMHMIVKFFLFGTRKRARLLFFLILGYLPTVLLFSYFCI